MGGSRFVLPRFSAWAQAALMGMAWGMGGCAGAVPARATITYPAVIPVRAVPHILVRATSPEARTVAERVVAHLAAGGSRVRLVSPLGGLSRKDAQPKPPAPPASVVMELEASFRVPAPDPFEGPFADGATSAACFGLHCGQRLARPVQELLGTLTIRVFDGSTGRLLQRQALSLVQRGFAGLALRTRLLDALSQRAFELLSQREEAIQVELLPVAFEAVRQALSAIRDGRWSAGRRQLECFVQADTFAALPPETQARVYYDLGVARRFDRVLPPAPRFRSARAALERAASTFPDTRYWRALSELEAHRRTRSLVRAQQQAMVENFRLLEAPPRAVPEPPRSYREARVVAGR